MVDCYSRTTTWLLALLVATAALLFPATLPPARAAPDDTPVPFATDNVEEWAVGSNHMRIMGER